MKTKKTRKTPKKLELVSGCRRFGRCPDRGNQKQVLVVFGFSSSFCVFAMFFFLASFRYHSDVFDFFGWPQRARAARAARARGVSAVGRGAAVGLLPGLHTRGLAGSLAGGRWLIGWPERWPGCWPGRWPGRCPPLPSPRPSTVLPRALRVRKT